MSDEVRQLLIHPAAWEPLVAWLQARGIDVKPYPFSDGDDVPTYFMSIPDPAGCAPADDTDLTPAQLRQAAIDGQPVTVVASREEYEAALSEPTHEAWNELRLAGEPPGARPYDVTVRSDTYDTDGTPRWTQLANVARLALGLREGHAWTDVTVHRRHVETTRRESAWVEMSTEELEQAGRDDA